MTTRLQVLLRPGAPVDAAGAAVHAAALHAGLGADRSTRVRATVEELLGEARAREFVDGAGDLQVRIAPDEHRLTVEVVDHRLPIGSRGCTTADVTPAGGAGVRRPAPRRLARRRGQRRDRRGAPRRPRRPGDRRRGAGRGRAACDRRRGGVVGDPRDVRRRCPRGRAVRVPLLRLHLPGSGDVPPPEPEGVAPLRCAALDRRRHPAARSWGTLRSPSTMPGRRCPRPASSWSILATAVTTWRSGWPPHAGGRPGDSDWRASGRSASRTTRTARRRSWRCGGIETGLLIGATPAALTMEGLENAAGGRHSLLAMWTPVARTTGCPDPCGAPARAVGVGARRAQRTRPAAERRHRRAGGGALAPPVDPRRRRRGRTDPHRVHRRRSGGAGRPRARRPGGVRACGGAGRCRPGRPECSVGGGWSGGAGLLLRGVVAGGPRERRACACSASARSSVAGDITCARPEGEAIRDAVLAEWHRVRR